MSGHLGSSAAGPGPVKGSNLPYCHEITKYEKLAKVGEGTFG